MGREGENEGEKHRYVASPQPTEPATQACVLTGNRTSNLKFCRTVSTQLSHTSQCYLFFNNGIGGTSSYIVGLNSHRLSLLREKCQTVQKRLSSLRAQFLSPAPVILHVPACEQ